MKGVEMRKIYHTVNREVRVIDETEYELFRASDLRHVHEWVSDRTEYGEFLNELLAGPGLYLRRVWRPALGYCWEEEEIYRITTG